MRRCVLLAVTGAAASVLAVVAGRHAFTATSTPPTTWLGLLGGGYRDGDPWHWGALLWVGLTGLSACWLWALRLVTTGRLTARETVTVAVTWSAPLAIGPPLVSKDVYAYAAHAVMTDRGLDVYRRGASALGSVPGQDAARALAAVDPRWQHTHSPYGPLSTLAERLAGAVGGGDPVVALIVLRLLAVLGVAATVWVAARLSSDRAGIVLVALNPLLLVHALSAAHVEALMLPLLLGGLLVARRGHWTTAVVLAVLGGAVKAPAFLAVPAIVAWHVLRTDGTRERAVALTRDVVAAAVAIVVSSLVVPGGWGWIRNLSAPSAGDPTSSITGTIAKAFGGSDLVRQIGAAVAVAIVVYLAVTLRERRLETTVGFALLAVAFLAPVTYPWYALWGVLCLLPTASGRVREALIALCVVETTFSIPGAPAYVTNSLRLATLVAATVVLTVRFRRTTTAPLTSTV